MIARGVSTLVVLLLASSLSEVRAQSNSLINPTADSGLALLDETGSLVVKGSSGQGGALAYVIGQRPQPTHLDSRLPLELIQDSESQRGGVWRGVVAGFTVGAVTTFALAVWASAAASLDFEDVAGFYVPVGAAAGAAGGALLGAATGPASQNGVVSERLQIGVEAYEMPGLAVRASLAF
jgi:hypothetical protein